MAARLVGCLAGRPSTASTSPEEPSASIVNLQHLWSTASPLAEVIFVRFRPSNPSVPQASLNQDSNFSDETFNRREWFDETQSDNSGRQEVSGNRKVHIGFCILFSEFSLELLAELWLNAGTLTFYRFCFAKVRGTDSGLEFTLRRVLQDVLCLHSYC